jgi:hypothetical protein
VLVPIAPPGATSYLWTLPGGSPDTSMGPTPQVRWDGPGSYAVTLVVGGPSGSATAGGTVVVTPASDGAACATDDQCQSGACLCGAGDGASSCPGALAAGLCARACAGSSCGAGELCADLSRSGGNGNLADPWRAALCLPACLGDGDCRAGFRCRELPSLPPGGQAGGTFSWAHGCFPDLLGAVGDGCRDPQGALDPSACVTGACAPLGARGLCTLDCAAAACPPEAVCAAFTDGAKRCLARCDPMASPCADPLLDCAPAEAAGPWGYTVPMGEPMGATYCGPRRCAAPADCPPAGQCDGADGGAFCACKGAVDGGLCP